MTNLEIIDTVSKMLNISQEQIKSKSRKNDIVEARYLAIWFLRIVNRCKLQEIGKLLNRDHSTVIYAIDRVFEAHIYNRGMQIKYDLINNELEWE